MLLMVCCFIFLLHSGSLGAKCPGTAKRCALASLNANVPSSILITTLCTKCERCIAFARFIIIFLGKISQHSEGVENSFFQNINRFGLLDVRKFVHFSI